MFLVSEKIVRKPENFTEEQVEAIRRELRRFQARHPELTSQQKMADAFSDKDVSIGQQAMGLYLDRKRPAGFTYGVATRLVKKMGYEGVDHFFAQHGLEHGKQPKPATGETELDDAIRVARILGIDEDVIEYVAKQYKSGALRARKSKYLVTEMGNLERYKLQEREPAPPSPITALPPGAAEGKPARKRENEERPKR